MKNEERLGRTQQNLQSRNLIWQIPGIEIFPDSKIINTIL